MIQEQTIKPLSSILDPTFDYLDYLPSNVVIGLIYGGSRSKFTRDLMCINALRESGQIASFTRAPRQQAFDRDSLEIMWKFRQLVELFNSYEAAVKRIQEV